MDQALLVRQGYCLKKGYLKNSREEDLLANEQVTALKRPEASYS